MVKKHYHDYGVHGVTSNECVPSFVAGRFYQEVLCLTGKQIFKVIINVHIQIHIELSI